MKTISILGILVALIPFLGIPSSWKTVLFVVFGIIIFAKAYSIMRNHKGLEEIKNNSYSSDEEVEITSIIVESDNAEDDIDEYDKEGGKE